MMKIAVACDGNKIAEHFGHCENFNIFTAQDRNILEEKIVPNPGHKPGFLPNYLNDLGINLIISGGMGQGAIDIFNENGIEVMTGINGNPKEIVVRYLKGDLKAMASACRDHIHPSSGNEA